MIGVSKRGYVTYLRNPDQHTNAAPSHAGWGATAADSGEAALYWVNQWPWVVTVRADRAPKWAREEAMRAIEERDPVITDAMREFGRLP